MVARGYGCQQVLSEAMERPSVGLPSVLTGPDALQGLSLLDIQGTDSDLRCQFESSEASLHVALPCLSSLSQFMACRTGHLSPAPPLQGVLQEQ